jgi:ribonuclease P protein component
MLKKDHRLTKQKEVEYVFKKGKSSYNNIIGIKAVKSEQKNSRFVIIVGLKVSKKAVQRNKLKRRVAHILKECLPEFNKKYDVAVVVLPASKDKQYQELRKTIRFHLKRLKII